MKKTARRKRIEKSVAQMLATKYYNRLKRRVQILEQEKEQLEGELERWKLPASVRDYQEVMTLVGPNRAETALSDIAKMIRFALGDGVNPAAGVRQLIEERHRPESNVVLRRQLGEAVTKATALEEKVKDMMRFIEGRK